MRVLIVLMSLFLAGCPSDDSGKSGDSRPMTQAEKIEQQQKQHLTSAIQELEGESLQKASITYTLSRDPFWGPDAGQVKTFHLNDKFGKMPSISNNTRANIETKFEELALLYEDLEFTSPKEKNEFLFLSNKFKACPKAYAGQCLLGFEQKMFFYSGQKFSFTVLPQKVIFLFEDFNDSDINGKIEAQR